MANDSRTLNVVVEAQDNASKTLDNVSKSVGGLSTGAQDLAKKAIIPLGAAFAGVVAMAKTTIDAFIEAEDTAQNLRWAFVKMTDDADVTADLMAKFTGLASEMQKVTRFSDEQVMSSTALMTSYGLQADVLEQATWAAADLASQMKIDLVAASRAVGMALDEPTEALGRLRKQGIYFSEEQQTMIQGMVDAGDKAGAQALILKALEQSFGGAAKAAGTTFGGQLTILRNTIDDLQERIGEGLVKQLVKLVGGMDNVSGKVAQLSTFFDEHQDILMGVVGAIGVLAIGLGVLLASALAVAAGTTLVVVGAIGALLAVIGFAVGFIATNWGALSELFTLVAANIIASFEGVKTSVVDFFTNFNENLTEFITNVGSMILKFFVEDIPYAIGFMIGWVTTAIPGFVEQFVGWFIELPARLLAIFQAVYTTLSAKLLEIMAWITKEVSTWPMRIQSFIASLPLIVTQVFDDVKKGALTKMEELWKGITDWWTKIKDIFTQLGNMVNDTLGKVAQGIEAGKKGFTSRQYGGYVPTTGLAMLHEGEFVVSKDMQAGRSAISSSVSHTYNQPITINPTLSGEPDFDLLGYKLAWVLRNAR